MKLYTQENREDIEEGWYWVKVADYAPTPAAVSKVGDMLMVSLGRDCTFYWHADEPSDLVLFGPLEVPEELL